MLLEIGILEGGLLRIRVGGVLAVVSDYAGANELTDLGISYCALTEMLKSELEEGGSLEETPREADWRNTREISGSV